MGNEWQELLLQGVHTTGDNKVKNKRKNYVGGAAPPTWIKEKEISPQAVCLPHQV